MIQFVVSIYAFDLVLLFRRLPDPLSALAFFRLLGGGTASGGAHGGRWWLWVVVVWGVLRKIYSFFKRASVTREEHHVTRIFYTYSDLAQP